MSPDDNQITAAILNSAFEVFSEQLFEEWQITMDESGMDEPHQLELVEDVFGDFLAQQYKVWLEG